MWAYPRVYIYTVGIWSSVATKDSAIKDLACRDSTESSKTRNPGGFAASYNTTMLPDHIKRRVRGGSGRALNLQKRRAPLTRSPYLNWLCAAQPV